MELGQEKELEVIYGTQKSFYKKAITRTDVNSRGTYHSLFSYSTFIIEIKEFDNGEKIINAITDNSEHFTNATVKHLNEFIQQHGMEYKTKKQWLEIQANQTNYDY